MDGMGASEANFAALDDVITGVDTFFLIFAVRLFCQSEIG